MKKLFKRIKLWLYWRRKHSTEGFLYELLVLFGIQTPFSFRVNISKLFHTSLYNPLSLHSFKLCSRCSVEA